MTKEKIYPFHDQPAFDFMVILLITLVFFAILDIIGILDILWDLMK